MSNEITRPDWSVGTFDNKGNAVVADGVPATSSQTTHTFEGRKYDNWNFSKDGTPKGNDAVPVDLLAAGPENSGVLLGLDQDMLGRWAKEGGVAQNLQRVQNAVGSIIAALGDGGEVIAERVDAFP